MWLVYAIKGVLFRGANSLLRPWIFSCCLISPATGPGRPHCWVGPGHLLLARGHAHGDRGLGSSGPSLLACGCCQERSFSEKPAPCCLKPSWELLDSAVTSISRKESCPPEGGARKLPATGSTGQGSLQEEAWAEMSRCRSQVRKLGTQSRHLGDKERFPLRLASCANWKKELEK